MKWNELLNKCDTVDLTNESDQSYVDDKCVGSNVGVVFHYNTGSCGPRSVILVGKIWKEGGTRFWVCYRYPMFNYHSFEVGADRLCDTVECEVNEGDVCLTQLVCWGLWKRAKVMHVSRDQDNVVVELIDRAGLRLDHTHVVSTHQVVRHSDSSLCETMDQPEITKIK